MPAVQTLFDIRPIQSSGVAFESIVHLRPIHDEAGYDQMVADELAAGRRWRR
jgi:hypothetical protein